MSLIFGLTGGIATGKSAVARVFIEAGVPVIDADVVAREVVSPGSEGLAAVAECFGPSVLLPDGSLDRKELGRLVFSDEKLRLQLESIIHPRIAKRSAEHFRALATQGVPLICYEAALLVEKGLYKGFRPLVVVTCAPQLQRDRLAQRDHLSPAEIDQRLLSQNQEQKMRLADYLISNEGTFTSLHRAALTVLEQIREKLPKPAQ